MRDLLLLAKGFMSSLMKCDGRSGNVLAAFVLTHPSFSDYSQDQAACFAAHTGMNPTVFWPRHGYDERLSRLIDSSSSLTAKKECRVEPSQHRKHQQTHHTIRLGHANRPGRVHHDGARGNGEGTVSWVTVRRVTYTVTRNVAQPGIPTICSAKNRLNPVRDRAA